MSAARPGPRELPASQYDLSTYWGRVRHAADLSDPRCVLAPAAAPLTSRRTLFTTAAGLERAKQRVAAYQQGREPEATAELWRAKKVVDATLHPDTGEPVFLPLRMSCFVLSNLVVTAGMLTPGLGVRRLELTERG